jgi:hypothetical protein
MAFLSERQISAPSKEYSSTIFPFTHICPLSRLAAPQIQLHYPRELWNGKYGRNNSTGRNDYRF